MRGGHPTGQISSWQWLWLLLLPALLLLPDGMRAGPGLKSDVILSKHNLSATGPGPVTSGEEDACIFCHTPHTSFVDVKPLWNHELSTQTYDTYALYTSSTYDAVPPTGSPGISKLCLSCHDGTVALGQTVSKGLIATSGSMGPDANLLTDLTNDHPLGIQPVDDGQLVLSLFQNPPVSTDPDVQLPAGRIECTTCHDPHSPTIDPVAQKFLVRSNSGGAICLACHDPSQAQPNALNGWFAGAHSTATNTVPTTGSFGPYGTVNANACGNCHRLHSTGATAAARLLRGAEEAACSLCHAGSNVTPPAPNVMADFADLFAHPTTTQTGLHDPTEDAFPLSANRHAECADCHSPHAAALTDIPETTQPPLLQPPLTGASGFDGATALRPATNEYELCFKCHADSTNKPQVSGDQTFPLGRIPNRQGEQNVGSEQDRHNLRLKLASTIARHNVTQASTGVGVPSLRPFMLNVNGSPSPRSLGAGTYIYCTDCHASDDARKTGGTGANGPHGSIYPHILTQRYELEIPPSAPGQNDGQGNVYTSGPYNPNGPFALCDKCHDLQVLVQDNGPFPKHTRHTIGEPASCSTCHDPHGIHDVAGNSTTTNPHMVSFDLTIIGPTTGGELRIDSIAKECYLKCHGRAHNPKRY